MYAVVPLDMFELKYFCKISDSSCFIPFNATIFYCSLYVIIKYICAMYMPVAVCVFTGGSIAISVKDVIKRFGVELLQQLPLDDALFLAMARRADLFPLNTEDHIRAKPTRVDKVDYFLKHVVEPGADKYLPKLLKVMKESNVNNVVRLAEDIQAAIEPGRYIILYTH